MASSLHLVATLEDKLTAHAESNRTQDFLKTQQLPYGVLVALL